MGIDELFEKMGLEGLSEEQRSEKTRKEGLNNIQQLSEFLKCNPHIYDEITSKNATLISTTLLEILKTAGIDYHNVSSSTVNNIQMHLILLILRGYLDFLEEIGLNNSKKI